ncbi:MAG: hypothetical protein ACYCOU_05725 [Sulfobacillus sp.]
MNLYDFIKTDPDPEQVISLIIQVLAILDNAMELRFCHNDLRCDNVLVKKTYSSVATIGKISIRTLGYVASICDFNWSAIYYRKAEPLIFPFECDLEDYGLSLKKEYDPAYDPIYFFISLKHALRASASALANAKSSKGDESITLAQVRQMVVGFLSSLKLETNKETCRPLKYPKNLHPMDLIKALDEHFPGILI